MRDLVLFVQLKKREKNTHGGELLLVTFLATACNFTKCDSPPGWSITDDLVNWKTWERRRCNKYQHNCSISGLRKTAPPKILSSKIPWRSIWRCWSQTNFEQKWSSHNSQLTQIKPIYTEFKISRIIYPKKLTSLYSLQNVSFRHKNPKGHIYNISGIKCSLIMAEKGNNWITDLRDLRYNVDGSFR